MKLGVYFTTQSSNAEKHKNDRCLNASSPYCKYSAPNELTSEVWKYCAAMKKFFAYVVLVIFAGCLIKIGDQMVFLDKIDEQEQMIYICVFPFILAAAGWIGLTTLHSVPVLVALLESLKEALSAQFTLCFCQLAIAYLRNHRNIENIDPLLATVPTPTRGLFIVNRFLPDPVTLRPYEFSLTKGMIYQSIAVNFCLLLKIRAPRFRFDGYLYLLIMFLSKYMRHST